MRYKNTKTGAVIEAECLISGGDWKKVRERSKTDETKGESLKTEGNTESQNPDEGREDE